MIFKRKTITWVSIPFFMLGFIQMLWTQTCPPPENFQANVVLGQPIQIFLTWSPPPNTIPSGYQLVIENNGSFDTIVLAATINSYAYQLPPGTIALDFYLATICQNGEMSDPFTIKRTFLIIEDLVLVKNNSSPEAMMCANPCPTSTHFCYVDPSKGWPLFEPGSQFTLYKRKVFCDCMNRLGNDYALPGSVDQCKSEAEEIVTLNNEYVVTWCGRLRERFEEETTATYGNLMISPNPSEGRFRINKNDWPLRNVKMDISVFNIQGEMIYEKSLHEDGALAEIDLSTVPTGLYFIRVKQENMSGEVFKVLKL